jgi:hypothetical protein
MQEPHVELSHRKHPALGPIADNYLSPASSDLRPVQTAKKLRKIGFD